MKERCKKITGQLDRWFELTDKEKQAIRKHALECTSCAGGLSSTEQLMSALDRSAAEYDRITYTGPPPPLPEERPVRFGLFRPATAFGLAAAVVIVIVLVWSGRNTPPTPKLAKSPSPIGHLRIPSVPSSFPSIASIPMTPGALRQRMVPLEREVAPSLLRSLRIPDRPKRPKPYQKKETNMPAANHA